MSFPSADEREWEDLRAEAVERLLEDRDFLSLVTRWMCEEISFHDFDRDQSFMLTVMIDTVREEWRESKKRGDGNG